MIVSAPIVMKGEDTFQNKSFPTKRGIYFIHEGEEIVYVGRSGNIWIRLAGHCSNFYFKEGMKASYILIEEEKELRVQEKAWINRLRPRLNSEWNRGINDGMFMEHRDVSP